MNGFPKTTPTRADALVVLAVLALAALCAARFWVLPPAGAAEVVVSINGTEVERLPLTEAERSYENNGYTVHLTVTAEGARVDRADCPTQDCVRTGVITRAGQSIVCLPARVVITLTGETGANGYDVIAG